MSSKTAREICKEVSITCRKKKCGKRFRVKTGKNNGYLRTYRCPYCDTINFFTVDENGKVRGSPSI